MPSAYSPPDVVVEQHQRTRTAPRLVPQMSVVVVGPARQIITKVLAGTYEANAEFQATLPQLKPGAVVDPDTVEVFLDVTDDYGNAVGLFQLAAGTDYELLAGDETIRIPAGLTLEYSLLSTRNNQAGSTGTARGTGTPNAIEFTDDNIDFLSRGASEGGDSFIVIDSPASMAGRYRIIELIHSGSSVFTVRVIKVDSSNVPELQKAIQFVASAGGTGVRTLYGACTDHAILNPGTNDTIYGNSIAGGVTNDITTGSTHGIGVDQRLVLTGTTEEILTTNLDDLFALVGVTPVAIKIPNRVSNTAQWFTPNTPNPAAPGEANKGKDTPIWRSLMGVIRVGDWMRFKGKFGEGTATSEYRDYKVVAIDTVDYEVQLQNVDLPGTPVGQDDLYEVTPTSLSGKITSISFLRPLRGRNDQAGAAGDVIRGVTTDGTPYNIEIVKANPSYVETVVDMTDVGLTPPASAIIRGIPFRGQDATYDLVRRTSTGYTGLVETSYKALRTDLSLEGLLDIGDQADIEDKIGVIHPDNPLALMADMVARSGLTSGGRVFFALATDGDTLADHQAAMDTLKTADVYYVVPATQDSDILAAYRSHVIAQSQPAMKHERRLVMSLPLVLTERAVPAADNDPIPQGDIELATPNRVTMTPNADALSIIRPGMVVSILDANSLTAGVSATGRVKDVNVSGGYFTVLEDFPDALLDTTDNYFRIDTYPLDKSEVAEVWMNEAMGLTSYPGEGEYILGGRISIVRPDECLISYTDKTGTKPTDLDIRVPMFYGCAAYAGVCASLAPQSPKTNVPVPSIKQLYHSNDYFDPEQLNTIAEGGNNILVQPSKNSSPRSRHQLTTDVSTLETREQSIVEAVDFVAKIFRLQMRPYIGNHNITQEFLAQLRGISESIMRGLVEGKVVDVGSQVMRLYQDPDNLDSVIVEVSLKVFYPCNRIVVKLFV